MDGPILNFRISFLDLLCTKYEYKQGIIDVQLYWVHKILKDVDVKVAKKDKMLSTKLLNDMGKGGSFSKHEYLLRGVVVDGRWIAYQICGRCWKKCL